MDYGIECVYMFVVKMFSMLQSLNVSENDNMVMNIGDGF